MAEQVIRQKVDDLEREGGVIVPADEQLTFGLEGTSYIIDLSTDNAKKLREILDPYVRAATPVIDHTERKNLSPPQAKRAELEAIREWAENQGTHVNRRGRIPKEIIDKYELVNGPLQYQ
jgi:hypothetical protein